MYSNSSSIFSYSPYSFQGQEHDDEVKGEGNSVNYKYRMHDPRVGRFFAVDPLASKYPWNGSYNFSENRVIDCGELEGLEVYYAADGSRLGQIGTSTDVRVVKDEDVKEAKLAIGYANHNYTETERITRNLHDQKYEKGWIANRQRQASRHLKLYSKNKKIADNLSEDVGMKEDELQLRAFLTVLQHTEAHSMVKGESYDKNVPLNSSGQPDYSQNPQDHVPGKGVNTSTGCYQIKKETFDWVEDKTGLDLDMSPANQDLIASWLIIKYCKVDLNFNGNKMDAALKNVKLNGQWSSLPGGSQPGLKTDQVKQVFKAAISNELKGDENSSVETPQGELRTNF